ncbi:hypothetical protein TPHA_0D01410 [Tetrapisispora phaffii CBS 4417]|uniref:Transferrin receptor-like dimerisation domain-containing protein n=1 Tax=Tetrapisispora phaffii (strain ATCC 24235 / CBS 4417 / NBRC 1672 / NRRL Y-8282 / UCD 70-5) TaxID=1071381 RepID=G8BSG1_TETPH|nr:hypothetical protein TPHA_0D01410 [Tetrapisispora phaffii CBS 4417]CCE62782.1 hypothetical protein TPHA_0D01410 [Tetrapisispora phaffii CBS 4417]
MVKNNYERVSTTDAEHSGVNSPTVDLVAPESNNLSVEDDLNLSNDTLPVEPPTYDDAHNLENINNFDEEMQMEDLNQFNNEGDETMIKKMKHVFKNLNYYYHVNVKEKILDPIFIISEMFSEKIDFYLNKVGNPLILRRFFYIIFMSIVSFVVVSSGLLPSSNKEALLGMFTNIPVLLQYSKISLDLAKLENDLEYISSMPHSSGSRGDTAIKDYIKSSFRNNGLKSVIESEYPAYANYYNSANLTIYTKDNKKIDIPLDDRNWNPFSLNGSVSQSNLIYANQGSLTELSKLKKENMITDNTVLLMDYSKLVSEQVLAAQKYGAKGVLFISNVGAGNGDLVQSRSVALNQFYTGDALTPGWTGHAIQDNDFGSAPVLPKLLSLPISQNQAKLILDALSHKGVKLDNGAHSGIPGDVKVDFSVATTIRERHSVFNIMGKIEGREQSEKAIIIAASRNSYSYGTSYPNFGTSVLLSLVQLFEGFKYKFNWRPLRSIYFISFGGSEFNYAGAAEFVEQRTSHIRKEVYSVLDISQLGITSNSHKIDIQTHPLLKSLFMSDDNKLKFDVHVSDVHQYGDWTPFLANGVPVTILSSKQVTQDNDIAYTDQDTFDKYSELLHENDRKNLTSDLMTYLLNIILKMVDVPLLPFDIRTYQNELKNHLSKAESLYGKKLNFKDVSSAINKWKRIAIEQESWIRSWDNIVVQHSSNLEPSLLSIHRWNWNKLLSTISTSQISVTGIYKRRHYKNILFGPAVWTNGLSDEFAWVFPGLRDAADENAWNEAQIQLDVITGALVKSLSKIMDGRSDNIYQ